MWYGRVRDGGFNEGRRMITTLIVSASLLCGLRFQSCFLCEPPLNKDGPLFRGDLGVIEFSRKSCAGLFEVAPWIRENGWLRGFAGWRTLGMEWRG